ncbi:MAG: hypothetical protein HY821_17295 [Acidobacteria bacterium]|nr:hypothetical protein [Acidobacteriota bacterium]
MAELSAPFLRQLFRFGTGAGIVADERDLHVCLTRVRPNGARVLATLLIEDYRNRPAAEWGAEYAAFLKANSAAHLAALVVLPRSEVIVRYVRLPGVADEDAPAAIRFQIDSLHPFQDEEVASDFHRIGRSDTFLVALAQGSAIAFYTSLFAEAGIQLAGLTFSGGAVYPSIRLFAPPARPLLAVKGLHATAGSPVEIYGESDSHPVFSAEFDMPVERAVALASAELRIEPGTEARDLADLLPAWQSAPESFDFSDSGKSRFAPIWAASLAAACPRLGSPVNLLPLELRKSSSRAMYVPTIVLASILALLLVILLGQRSVMQSRYSGVLESEVARLSPHAAKLEALDRRIATSSLRIQQLDQFRQRTRSHLDIVLDLTQMLPPPAYLMSLQVSPKEVIVAGEIEQADTLLKKLDSSPRFANSEFTMPLARTGTGEVFRIRSTREGGQP